MPSVLVAYGSTEGIASRIACRLADGDVRTDPARVADPWPEADIVDTATHDDPPAEPGPHLVHAVLPPP